MRPLPHPTGSEGGRELKSDKALIWVTHEQVTEQELRKASQLGIDGIQLRCKEGGEKRLLALAKVAREVTRAMGVSLVINSSITIALDVEADGIHLPEAQMERCKEVKGKGVGVSVHSLEAAIHAQELGVGSVTFGPIFSTPSKISYGSPQGVEALAVVTQELSLPVYAIGGITFKRLPSCWACGAAGVMMQSELSKKVREKF